MLGSLWPEGDARPAFRLVQQEGQGPLDERMVGAQKLDVLARKRQAPIVGRKAAVGSQARKGIDLHQAPWADALNQRIRQVLLHDPEVFEQPAEGVLQKRIVERLHFLDQRLPKLLVEGVQIDQEIHAGLYLRLVPSQEGFGFSQESVQPCLVRVARRISFQNLEQTLPLRGHQMLATG
ncbi:hypothetical protein D3C87_1571090 [compost metagenome]